VSVARVVGMALFNQRAFQVLRKLWRVIQSFAVLLNTHACQATDPHERVYALPGMAVNGREFEVDYSKGPSRVYRDLSVHFIRRDNNLNIMGFAGGKTRARGGLRSRPGISEMMGGGATLPLNPVHLVDLADSYESTNRTPEPS
jgi:hypothetical protein